MNMTKQELALVNFVKALPFEALLDAGIGIEKSVEEANIMALKLKAQGNPNEAGFRVRAHELTQLSEMLGDINADYRAHIYPEEAQAVTGKGVIQMLNSNAGEVIHLFEVMQKYGASCSLEFKAKNALDPLIGIVQGAVNVEYFEGTQGDSVIIELDGASFSFELRNHSFSKFVSDCQIEVCVMENNGNYSAFFNSGVVQPDGIKEACNFNAMPGERYFAIDIRGESVTQSFEDITSLLREGWSINSIGESVGNDGHLYIDMTRPTGEESP